MNPYLNRPSEAFWKTAVAQVAPTEIGPLWRPKWPMDRRTRIATAGSCFAQHFGQALRARGYAWIDREPPPEPLSPETRRLYGYDLFSARTGNIYTARQLLQWLTWALDGVPVPVETWQGAGRHYDPFRPRIEPEGFASPEELVRSRATTLAALKAALGAADVFVFTLGLTECWRDVAQGHEYQSSPGLALDTFDTHRHRFHNQTFSEISADLSAAFALMRRFNPGLRILLTVSPVSLVATASGQHVLVATAHAKAVLRAAAGELAARDPACDYFPSYEIVTGAPFRGMFLAPNLRTVTSHGVDFVMRAFFAALEPSDPEDRGGMGDPVSRPADPLCDEELLDQFARL